MILLEDKENVTPPGGAYPYGNIKDDDGSGNGTPLNTLVHADYIQTFAKMFAESGISSNGLPDNSTNGFQYYEALLEVIRKKFSSIIISDADDIDSSGFFFTPTGTSTPTSVNTFIFSEVYDANTMVQIAFPGNSAGMYFRQKSGGVWSSWKTVITSVTPGTLEVTGGIRTESAGPYYLYKKTTINNWDMDTDATKNVPHSLTDSKISKVTVWIQDNVVGRWYNLLNAGGVVITSTDLLLSRDSGGVFDAAAFVNTPIRIYIETEV